MDIDAAEQLIYDLVSDPALRQRFRADAAATCRSAGYDEIAEEMAAAEAKAVYTVDLRESKSSLAGVLMAAAVEGVVLAEVLSTAASAGGELAELAGRVTVALKVPDVHVPKVDVPGVDIPDFDLRNIALPGASAGAAAAVGGAGLISNGSDQGPDPSAAAAPPPAPAPDLAAPPEAASPSKSTAEPRPAAEAKASTDAERAKPGEPAEPEAPTEPAEPVASRQGVAQPFDADANQTLTFSSGSKAGQRAGDSSAGNAGTDTLSFRLDRDPEPKAAPAIAEPLTVGGPRDYPGDDASPQEFAAWMSAEAKERGLPPELPVMAALVESNLQNLSGGDRDSVGFFQMRVGIWNEGAYEGYPDKPELQLKWFLDQAESVRAQRVAAGRSVSDPQQFGEWIADVERPAAQYRGRYQLQLERARGLVKSGAALAAPSAGQAEPQTARLTHAEQGHPGHDHADHEHKPMSAHAAGRAALENRRLHFDATGIADLKAGRIDPRLIAVLTRLAKDHDLRISCMRSDHSKMTAGGSISNHWHGRGVDIAAVDGQPVNPGNAAARQVAEKIGRLDPDYRPSEIGSPWAIAGSGHFTDGAHQDHLHVGFDSELPTGWRAPADVLPSAPAEPQAIRAGVVASGPAPDESIDTLSFPRRGERSADTSGNTDRGAGSSDRESSDTLSFPVPEREPAPRPAEGAVQPAGIDAQPAQEQPAARLGAGAAEAAGGAGEQALAAVAEAKKYLGTPYLWGGSSPKTGFDCSGLVQWAYAKQGIRIPRVTYDQIDAPGAQKIGLHALRPGDLVFFSNQGDVHHVGMSLGGDRFLHAPRTGDVVKISRLSESYYQQQFAGGRRFDRSAPATAPAEASARRMELTPSAEARTGDPTADRAAAESARVVDEADAKNPDTLVFQALRRQEASFHAHTLEFMAAKDPEGARAVKASAARAGLDLSDAPRGPGTYPGDDASQKELARWLAEQARRRGLPAELPVMASLVESGVRNLPGGHADSVGFFQMRVGIWNKGTYAGYPDKPELQARWFIDHALAVKRARIAAGDLRFGRDPDRWGEWIADVENPAAQYRGRYQERLAEARALLRD